ncbi:MAG: DNA mismatch repair endonuclease MutL [Oscillospiraceae bacterium]|jgi:DNA mismatch repair protein MutL|nr:DNA mismatch repair endonuclease MutL [Oscillospiraceae bacterium]
MAEINVLPPHLADLIAAGEVVERPASVVKELAENALDAGASKIEIRLRIGSGSFIQVKDDGDGMLPEDAGVCFLRHATSKLSSPEGLERINTMGFRGEALAAISAVSRIELITRRRGEKTGVRVQVEAGEIIDISEYGCPEGTSITVRDLFFNTPARRKFLKSDKAEASACCLAAAKFALANHLVTVRLVNDGNEEFFSPGDWHESSAIYNVLGAEFMKGLVFVSSQTEEVEVSGFISSPASCRGNRTKQFFFCNGRPISSLLLQSALEQAYKNRLMTGKFPACVLQLSISPASVDVNVHPAKTQVRFRDERAVFDAVYYAAMAALGAEGSAPELAIPAAAEQTDAVALKSGELDNDTIIIDRRSSGALSGAALHDGAAPYLTGQSRISGVFSASGAARQSAAGSIEAAASPSYGLKSAKPSAPRGFATEAVFHREAEVAPRAEESEAAPYRVIGEAMKTYLIVETEGQLLLIDKHAAHERMIFDRLLSSDSGAMAQELLTPVTIKASPEELELLAESSERLRAIGLELEPFGQGSLILRTVPADMDPSDASALVEELFEKLRLGEKLPPEEARESILRSVACKAAIKAGWDTEPGELELLAEAVVSGRVKYCPHGRPVAVTLTQKQLERSFGRIV